MSLTLHRLHLGYRVLYTSVLLFMAAGTAIHSVHQAERGGLAPSAVADWYRGNEDDPDATVFLFPKSIEEVWADVWIASTSYAIAFVVLGSIFFRSGVPRRLQAALLVPFAGLGLTSAAAPLLVRYVAPGFAWLLSVALWALPVIAATIAGIAIAEMWIWRTAGMRFEPRHGG